MARRKKRIDEACESVAWFTPSTLADDFAGHNFEKGEKSGKYKNWYGGSASSVDSLLRGGDLTAVAEASAIADKINDALDVAGVRSEWVPDVVGAFPSVPAYLVGDPCAMLARSPVQDERGEITVFVNTAVSSDCSARDMRRRGVCVLAALLALRRIRNVSAVVYASTGVSCPAVRLSIPLDVSELCAFVTCPQITRRALYGAACARGWSSGKWATWAAPISGDATERAAVRRLLGAGGDSVVITPDRLGSLAAASDADLIGRINGLMHAVASGDGDAGATL